MAKLPELNIGDLNIPVPIIQGGMGVRISLARLAAAVANEGGVGTISAALIGGLKSNLTLDDSTLADIKELVEELKKASALTTGVIAVNVMVALTNYSALVQAAAQNNAQIIVAGAGLPLTLPKLVEGTRAKIIPIVSSGRAADLICRTWLKKYDRLPDAMVVEGPKAGGHLGFRFEDLEPESAMPELGNIVSDVVKVAAQYGRNRKIPVIGGGGVSTGKDIADMLKRGASGVQIATRFVPTYECDASEAFKEAYVNAKKEDITIIKSPVGMPGRALNNDFIKRARRGEVKFKCFYQCLKTCNPAKSPYCIAQALINAADGKLDEAVVFVGANAWRTEKIVSVKDVVKELVTEAEANL
ncbi:MAG: nitronate monooxygenase family protein [Candidatus Omnitrophota bacterium]|nr:nitronate monooxygenase [Candidatus Omnitrophota bacterium]MBU2529137.1 nitronate monooxygenase family protein [bacterium]MBU3929484.1 nitronate monooxygenase family protein [bacterium]MBU4122819.1 nitronate monooxygenase family protein [bacterium]